MLKSKLIIGLVLSLGFFGGTASADVIDIPMTMTDNHIVGTISGGPLGSEALEMIAAQALLDLAMNATATIDGDTYASNTIIDFSGTLTDFFKPGGDPQSDELRTVSGYDYVMAKYDGPNAGYVLFALGDHDSLLIPQYPYDLWTENPEQWAISHWVGFNANTTTVPEPGTLLLLGAGLLGLGACRRAKAKA